MDGIEYAAYLLQQYNVLQGRIAVLEAELTMQEALDEQDTTAMLSQEPIGSETAEGALALIQQEAVLRIQKTSPKSLSYKLQIYRGELSRLEKALASLPPLWEAVLRGLYIEGRTYLALEEQLAISQRSISRYRKKALAALGDFLQPTSFIPQS